MRTRKLATGALLAFVVAGVVYWSHRSHLQALEETAISDIKACGGDVGIFDEPCEYSTALGASFNSWMEHLVGVRYRKITGVDLSNCKDADSLLLAAVNISSVVEIHASNSDLSDRSIWAILHHGSLRGLYLRKTRITDKLMSNLAGLRQLRTLDVSDTGVTDNGIKQLSLLDLLSLDLSVTKVSDVGMQHLPQSLAYLNLNRTALGDPGAAVVARLPFLYELDLEAANITDQAVESLSACSHLEVLSLAGNKLTDSAANSLAKYQSIRSVNLENSGVSPEAMQLLKQKRPLLTFERTR